MKSFMALSHHQSSDQKKCIHSFISTQNSFRLSSLTLTLMEIFLMLVWGYACRTQEAKIIINGELIKNRILLKKINNTFGIHNHNMEERGLRN